MTLRVVAIHGSEDSTLLLANLPDEAIPHIEQIAKLTDTYGGGMKPQIEVMTVPEWAEYAAGLQNPRVGRILQLPDNLDQHPAVVHQHLADEFRKAYTEYVARTAGRDNNSIGLFQQGPNPAGWGS